MSLLSSSSLQMASFLLITVMASSGGGSSGATSATTTNTSAALRYNAMFGFGDSMAETGNICASSTNKTELDALTCTHPAYGVTYFGGPACRWCNGRVVVDFIAQALGFPLLPPSKSKGKDFRRGANMAITGGTAMNFSFYKSLGVQDPFEACCRAGGGKYNFDVFARCGMPGATTAYRDPSARLSWDGIHPTEAANKMIADGWPTPLQF